MAPEISGYFEVLEKGVSALLQLSKDLQESCASLAGMDLTGIYQHIANQECLAAALHSIEEERKAWEHQFTDACGTGGALDSADRFRAAIGPEGEKQFRSFLKEIAASRRAVIYWNRLYAALLARSHQSVDALLNGLGCPQLNYPGLGISPEVAPLVSSRI